MCENTVVHGDVRAEVLHEAPPGWDAWISDKSVDRLTVHHTTGWARRMQELLGYRPRFVTVYGEGDEPLLRLVVSLGYPFRLRGARASARVILTAMAKARIGVLQWFGEPVGSSAASGAAYDELARALGDLSRRRLLRVSTGSWPSQWAESIERRWPTRAWATLLVDLEKPPEDLFASLKSSARKAVRRAERDGVSVRRLQTLEDVRQYYSFAQSCAARYRKQMLGVEDFESLWLHLRPVGTFETFVAEHNDEPIAGLSVWGCGRVIGELGSFQSERSFRDKLFGPDLIKWSIIQWGHSEGFSLLDLAGVHPNPATDKERNIRQFKEKWGGRYYEYAFIA